MGSVDFLHGGNIYEIEKKSKLKLIDFSANINPLGLPPKVRQLIYAEFDKVLHYPDPAAREIAERIAEYWGIDEENVLVGNGSVEFIYLIMSSFKPETTLIPVPAFSEYERAAKNVKSRILFVRLKEKDGFRFRETRHRADMFFLCNPNNPTGNLIFEGPKVIEKIDSKLIVVDEVFMDFLADQKKYTFIWKAVRSQGIAVLRSFTKFFALPGLRIGYLIAHKKIINKLKAYQPPWSTNSLAQIAAAVILNDRGYITNTYKVIEKERHFLFKGLSKIDGLRPFPSVTNFILVRMENRGITSKSLQAALIKKGILIRDCSNFRGLNDRYIRVAVRSREENLRLLAAI